MLLMDPGVYKLPVHVLLIGQECMSCDPCALGRPGVYELRPMHS